MKVEKDSIASIAVRPIVQAVLHVLVIMYVETFITGTMQQYSVQ